MSAMADGSSLYNSPVQFVPATPVLGSHGILFSHDDHNHDAEVPSFPITPTTTLSNSRELKTKNFALKKKKQERERERAKEEREKTTHSISIH